MALGHSLPRSVTTIRDQVFKYGALVSDRIKDDLLHKKVTVKSSALHYTNGLQCEIGDT